MTAIVGIGYMLLAFSPSFAIFRRFIMTDPLRIILFAFGAFFWLLSLLLSSLFWFVLLPLREFLSVSIVFSIIVQETARLVLFLLIKKAQKGLSFMAASDHHKCGVHTLYNARHMLAIVCGLGMGTMAAYFAIINVVADFWGEGTVGLPATVAITRNQFPVKLYAKDQFFPITYALSACFLTLCHIFWTVIFWDACHRKHQTPHWWKNILFVFISHLMFSGLSFFNQNGNPVVILFLQFVTVLTNAFFSIYAITKKLTIREVVSRFFQGFLTFFCCRTITNLPQGSRTTNNPSSEPHDIEM